MAVFGLGRMGAPIASALVRAGFDVVGYDPLAPTDAEVRRAVRARDAAQGAHTVITVLPGTPELQELMVGSAELLAQLSADSLWIDCTSTAPDVGADLAAAARAHGVRPVDCGLGGGPADARSRRVTLFVGGAPDDVEASRPVLEALTSAERIHHLGDAGSGVLAKLLVNLLWFGQAALIGEVLLLAQASGVRPEEFAALLPHTAAASSFVSKDLPGFLAGDLLASFGLDRIVEELDGLERLAGEHGSPFEVSGTVAAIHRNALEAFGPLDGELLAIARLEQLAGRRIVSED